MYFALEANEKAIVVPLVDDGDHVRSEKSIMETFGDERQQFIEFALLASREEAYKRNKVVLRMYLVIQNGVLPRTGGVIVFFGGSCDILADSISSEVMFLYVLKSKLTIAKLFGLEYDFCWFLL